MTSPISPYPSAGPAAAVPNSTHECDPQQAGDAGRGSPGHVHLLFADVELHGPDADKFLLAELPGRPVVAGEVVGDRLPDAAGQVEELPVDVRKVEQLAEFAGGQRPEL